MGALEEELNDFQPIYRNPLLQKLYKTTSVDCASSNGDDNLYNFISIKHGAWFPSEQYLKEAVDFSWADFQSKEETEDQELETIISPNQMSADDEKHLAELEKQIKGNRKKRKQEQRKLKKQAMAKQAAEARSASRRRLLAANP